MIATDLMIGDWVSYRRDYPDRINGISANAYSVYLIKDGWIPIEKINPIPLTPEILEKNGWKDISTHTLKGCDTFRLCLEQRSFDYTLTLKMRDYFRLDSYDDRVYTLCEVNFGFKYVHQLQHALRLCGVEKEIVL